MSKKSKSVLIIIAALIAVLSITIMIYPKNNYSTKLNSVVEITEGAANPSHSRTSITVSRKGRYVIAVDWWMEECPGFITALSITDENGNAVFDITGGTLFADSVPMELEQGKYFCNFEFLTNKESYLTYVTEHFDDSQIGDVDEAIFQDGVWDMQYSIAINQHAPYVYPLILVAGIAVGILLVALTITLSRKENAPVKTYDERQIAEQGKSYKYGFLTMITYYLLLILAFIINVKIPVETNLLIFVGVVLGLAVMITNSILKDAYFRADEKKGFLIGLFAFISVLCFIIGIINIVNGRVFDQNTAMFLGSSNLVCGAFSLYILLVTLIKNKLDQREE